MIDTVNFLLLVKKRMEPILGNLFSTDKSPGLPFEAEDGVPPGRVRLSSLPSITSSSSLAQINFSVNVSLSKRKSLHYPSINTAAFGCSGCRISWLCKAKLSAPQCNLNRTKILK